MSLATRCTHCGTIFKVVEDQLKVSEGWVRCGRCHEVFHAIPTLFDLEREPPPPRHASSVVPAAEPMPQADRDNPPSQPSELPSEWPPTQPQSMLPAQGPGPGDGPAAPEPQTPAGPRIGPQPAPPQTRSWLAPVPGTTEFDLDTRQTPLPPDAPAPAAVAPPPPMPAGTPGIDDIHLDTAVELAPKPEPLPDDGPDDDALSAPLSLRTSFPPDTDLDDDALVQDSEPPSDWGSPSRHALVPSTEESDALDSRYLLPSTRRDRPAAARRPTDAPDFADAEVPDDWLLDAEEHLIDPPSARPAPQPAARPGGSRPASPAVAPSAPSAPTAASAITVLAQGHRPAQQDDERSTIPSRFLDEEDAGGLAMPASPDAASAPPPAAATASDAKASAPSPGLRDRLRRKKARQPEPTPGFMQRAQAQARWRHPAVRAALGVTLIGLLVTLAGQVMHQFRNELAAYDPPLRPYLSQWCAQVGCTLQPPLRIEDLQVDTLSFVRATSEGPDVYRLTVVLHNKAPVDLAWPHIDLTLTDINGAMILRKVFSPQDAGWMDNADGQNGPLQGLPGAAPAQRSTTLQWRMKIARLQPVGYTADIFYP